MKKIAKKFKIMLAFSFALCYNIQVVKRRHEKIWYLGVAQLVARYLGVVEAASSSLVTQTKKGDSKESPFCFMW